MHMLVDSGIVGEGGGVATCCNVSSRNVLLTVCIDTSRHRSACIGLNAYVANFLGKSATFAYSQGLVRFCVCVCVCVCVRACIGARACGRFVRASVRVRVCLIQS